MLFFEDTKRPTTGRVDATGQIVNKTCTKSVFQFRGQYGKKPFLHIFGLFETLFSCETVCKPCV